MSPEIFLSALLMGALGAGHCLGMCGGISAALGFAIPNASVPRKLSLLLAYNLGRIASYTSIGALVGGLGSLTETLSSNSAIPFLRLLAACMLILTGLYISGWWRVLGKLEMLGVLVWRRLQPVANKFMPVKHISTAVILGGFWGWLPCGLVYSAVIIALTQGALIDGAAFMFAFGVGTLPAVLLGGLAAERLKSLLKKQSVRNASGIFLIVFGAWTMYFALSHAGHQHEAHEKHSAESTENSAHQHHH